MYPVTQEFESKIKMPIHRKVYTKVQIDYTDPSIDQTIQMTATENANVSYPQQTADGALSPSKKYASLDGQWKLDGSFALAPGTADEGQMGWWGSSLSDGSGKFEDNPTLIAKFAARPIWSLRVVGDAQRQEYPVEFSVRLYSEENILLHTENITDNDTIIWEKEIEAINEVAKMAMEIIKWSKPGCQVKILEFLTSIQETYEGDDIFTLDIIEEREVSQGSLPIGSISSNEIDLRLSNKSRKFDVGNRQSSIYGLVKPNRRIRAWLGVEKEDEKKEWVPLGVFWSGTWEVPDKAVHARTSGRDRLELLRKSTYSTSRVQENKTLHDLALDVLQDAGLKNAEYWIDDELKDYTVRYSYFESQTHREALRKITEACIGQAYCDREGVLRIEGPSFMTNKIAMLKQTYFLEGSYPTEIETIEAYGISIDNYFTKDNPAKDDELANWIEVETQPLQPDAMQEVYRSNDEITVVTERTFLVYYNDAPCINAVARLEGTGSIVDATYYAWGASVTVSAGTFYIVIDAQPLKTLNKERATAKDNKSIQDNGKLTYKFPGNPLVQSLDMAQKIADTLLQYYKDPRRDMTMQWRGNPALLLGDIVIVPEYHRGKDDQRGYYYVIKQELQCANGLRAYIEGRRAL